MEFRNSIELSPLKSGHNKAAATVLYAQSGTVENVVEKPATHSMPGLWSPTQPGKNQERAPEGTVFSYDCYEDLKIGLGGTS